MKCCKKGESKDNMEELISALQKKHISYDVALRFLNSNKLFLNMKIRMLYLFTNKYTKHRKKK